MYAKIIPTSYICKYTCVYLYYILYKAAFFMYNIYIYTMYNMSLCGLEMYIYTYIHIYINTYIHIYIHTYIYITCTYIYIYISYIICLSKYLHVCLMDEEPCVFDSRLGAKSGPHGHV